jgi:peptide/nickel transport system permease protein
VLGLLLLLFLYYDLTTKAHLHWFPAAGYVNFTSNPLEWAHHLILPWITLAVVSAAAYTRLSRSSMLDVLGEDYIRTARAKGLRERRVVLRHGLRAALTPIVTQFGIDLGVLIGGAVITEQVFSMQGLGFTAVAAIQNQDLPVILGVVIVASAAVVVANIIVDFFYAILDPRVRLT